MPLNPRWVWGDVDLTDAPYLFAFGAELGAPQTATEALAQLLLDGEVEVSSRASNRQLAFRVYVEATDLLDAAEREAELNREAEKSRNTLTFDPGDGYGPATVFLTFRAQMTFVRSDEAEAQAFRAYDIEMNASPFGRSVDPVETPALEAAGATPSTPTTVTMSGASTTTGWSARIGMLSDVGAELEVSGSRSPRVSFTAATDLSVTPFVSLLMYRTDPALGGITATTPLPAPPALNIDSHAAELVAAQPVTAFGVYAGTRYYWRAPSASGTVFEFAADFPNAGPYRNYTDLRIDQLERTNVPPITGTGRQKFRTVEVLGSARTQGSLLVEHEDDALGSVLVYTWPQVDAAYSPPLRERRVSGGTPTSNTALISGGSDNLDTALVFDVPVAELVAGAHVLVARLKSDTTGSLTLNYSAQLRVGTANIGTALTGTAPVTFAATGTWQTTDLGRLMLPPSDTPSSSTAVVRLTLVNAAPGGSNIDLDEAWLFNTSIGDMTVVECGDDAPSAGGASNRLWINAATVETQRPTIYRGTEATGSDAFYPPDDEVQSFGQHRFTPPLMNVFVVTSNALDAAASLTHYPYWHTHAGS